MASPLEVIAGRRPSISYDPVLLYCMRTNGNVMEIGATSRALPNYRAIGNEKALSSEKIVASCYEVNSLIIVNLRI